MKLLNYKAIIFDFDGVIAESVNVKTEAFSKIYSEYGEDIVKKVIAHHMSHGGISRYEKFKYYHKEFLGIKLNKDDLIILSNKFSELVVNDVIDAPYVPGALNFIKNNYKKYKLFISTGTPQDEMIVILKKKNIDMYFQSVYGSPELKTNHVKDIMMNMDYKKEEIIFIGDADTDVKAAKQNDIPIILRTHPYSNCNYEYKKLLKINNLINIIDVLSSIQN